MVYDIREATTWPVNELGEIIAQFGVGSTSTSGQLPASSVPVDPSTNKLVIRMPISGASPNNGVVLVGDSITQQNYVKYTVTAISRTNNVGTVVLSGTSPMFVGAPVQIWDVQSELSGNFTITGVGIPANSWTFASVGPDIASGTLLAFPRLTYLAGFSDTGYFTWGNILSLQKFDIFGISANTGRYTSEMLSRIGEVSQLGAGHAFVLGGTNDSGAGSGIIVATTIANLQNIYNTLIANGHTVWALTIPPIGAAAYNTTTVAKLMVINAWIRRKCKTTPGMRLVDAFSVLVDPAAANKGQALANVLQTDGLHPTRLGAYLLGKLINLLTANVPRCDERTTTPADNQSFDPTSNNVWDYAPWTNSGGSAPSNGATGVNPLGLIGTRVGAGTVAFDAPARADGFGYDQRATATASANGDGFTCGGGGNTWHGRLTGLVNPVIQSDVTVETSGLNGSQCFAIQHYFSLTINGVNQRYIYGLASSGSTDAESIKEDWVGIIRTPAIKLSLLPSNAFTVSRGDCGGLGSQFTVKWGRQSIRVS